MTAWTISEAKQVVPVRTNPRVRASEKGCAQREGGSQGGTQEGRAGRGRGERESIRGVCTERDGMHTRSNDSGVTRRLGVEAAVEASSRVRRASTPPAHKILK
jgi:hypothetical protein